MKVDIAAICDAATSQSGKLNLLGVFDMILAKNFPAIHPYCSIAFRVRLEEKDKRPEEFKICITDNEGNDIVTAVEGKVGYASGDNKEGNVDLTLNVGGLKLDKEGVYKVKLYLDKKLLKTLLFSAKRN